MAASRFSTFLESFNPDPKTRGTQWEHVCKWFLETDPVYRAQLKKVWLWKQWPDRPYDDEAGIDLVAQAKDGTLWAIQAKAYALDHAVTKKSMDSFLSESEGDRFALRLLITTSRSVGRKVRRLMDRGLTPPLKLQCRYDLDRRERFTWPASFAAWAKGRIPKTKPKRPYPHVRRAIRATLKKLKTHDRGQVIMACGTGKTLTALWVHEGLPSSRTLVLVPSLSLLGQTLQEWVGNAKVPFEMLPVCSDDTVRRGEDDALMSSTLDLGYPSTTEPDAVRTFLKRRGPRVVFATYQSSPVIADALAKTRQRFDLVIADEAHRCAGMASSAFATVLDPKKIPARKRIFMTATQRYYTGRIIKEAKAEQGDLEVASMDNEAVFGPVFHRLTFGQAIEQKLLSDYRVVIVGIDDVRYRRYAERGRLVKLQGVGKTDARTLAAHLGLAKTMRTYDMARVISFHGRVSGAKAFATAVPKIIDWMPRRERPSGAIWAEAVSGAMAAGARKTRLDRLRAVDTGERGLLSNARCLGEGIDVPTLNGIAFIDPKHSQVDIVQAVGRAIRKGDGTKTATIVLPVFVDMTADGDEVLDASAYRAIASVLRAMRDHDEELAEELDNIRRRIGLRKRVKVELPDKLVLDLPIGKAFSSAIRSKVVRLTTQSWEELYGQLVDYAKTFGDAHVSIPLKRSTDRSLRTWLAHQRLKRDRLPLERRKRLEALPGWTWDTRVTRWEEMFAAITSYVKKNGHSRVPRNYLTAGGRTLGNWITLMRSRRADVSKERQARLEALPGWTWHTKESWWEEMFAEVKAYAKKHKHVEIPRSVKGPTGQLARWIVHQRLSHFKGVVLTPAQKTKLAALPGWSWSPKEEQWEKTFSELVEYVEQHGTTTVPRNYVTRSGCKLGKWLTKQRHRQSFIQYPDRKQRLEELPGWTWNPMVDQWDQNYELLVEYVGHHGHARVPQSYRTSTGENLGGWSSGQRNRRSSVTPARQARLEALPGWTWDINQARWDDAFQHLLEYAKKHGHAVVPRNYVTTAGVKLGPWVSKQRRAPNALSQERRKKLEQVPGWVLNAVRSGKGRKKK